MTAVQPDFRQRFDWRSIAIDMVLALGVVLILLGLIVGYRTEVDRGQGSVLVLANNWHWVATLTILFLAGRLLMHVLVWEPKRIAGKARDPLIRLSDRTIAGIDRYGILIFAALALALPLIDDSRYTIGIATTVLTYVMLGWGLNIVVGLAGMLDLGYVAFYAVGAYSFALISQAVIGAREAAQEAAAAAQAAGGAAYVPGFLEGAAMYFADHPGLLFYVCLPIAGVLAAIWGVILGFPTLRLRGDYLAIVTLAFGEIIRVVLINWSSFSGGPQGVGSIPDPSFFGYPFTRNPPEGVTSFAELFGISHNSGHQTVFSYLLIVALALLTNWVTLRLRRQPIGRAWEALREDEIACRALGMNTRNVKLIAFATGAMFGGFAGCFFAARQGFIDPNSFVFQESAIILAIVVLGGMGSQIGVVLAAIFMIGGFEMLRQVPQDNATLNGFVQGWLGLESATELSKFRPLAFGLLMVLIMVWRPRGLLSVRQPTVLLPKTAEAAR